MRKQVDEVNAEVEAERLERERKWLDFSQDELARLSAEVEASVEEAARKTAIEAERLNKRDEEYAIRQLAKKALEQRERNKSQNIAEWAKRLARSWMGLGKKTKESRVGDG